MAVVVSSNKKGGAMLSAEKFKKRFEELTAGWDWAVKGLLDTNGNILPIDTDTKVISTVFERLASPVIRTIAKEFGYVVELANQTTYPDFTLTLVRDNGELHRIAIDVKTTYRSNRMMFTLGGYNSFIRNDTKNILHPYSTYREHWILGFIYTQNGRHEEYSLENLPTPETVSCPYKDVFVFLRKKHEITGLLAGSGNTKNIGSVRLGVAEDFATVQGPFTKFNYAKEACDHYWAMFESYCGVIDSEDKLLMHRDFAAFKE